MFKLNNPCVDLDLPIDSQVRLSASHIQALSYRSVFHTLEKSCQALMPLLSLKIILDQSQAPQKHIQLTTCLQQMNSF